MKLYTAFLLYIAGALTLACASPQSLNPSAKPDKVVIEIITTASGTVYPKEGDILDFRLYESGRFEYDDYSGQDSIKYVGGKVPITTKEARISADEVKELISLAERPDFLAAKENYPGLHLHVDDMWVTTIIFMHQDRKKKISAVDFWDMQFYPEDRAKYPVSMVKLLERVKELKAKAFRKA